MTASTQHELVLVREFDAPREKIYKAWTDPDLLKQWFVPRPWGVTEATLDVRPGGSSVVVMQDPEGNQYPNRGVYLEIVENEKIVFTDAYTSAWVPSEKPFFTGLFLLEDLGKGRTKYTAKALHWRAEDKEAHEKMGFHEGWGKAADQLAELLAKM
ncbi:SRPBCC family protein [Rhizobium laguerreae]|uniref:SRPBCC family protein n=1 Tax=Rhizobium laguerreae TaxID=1076926 RepID=UPI001C90572F|nr:SRPBCC family protein [Rhizobium laguerreae]MBY3102400.1 SRPBCC family protein [Rhizobium laguerreae]MBY3127823.1 SRPBCC family protein [Rhizobium laguerreae]MBY3140805.1 SRPBCC family protein [Rhizobium laguerreae]MBY3412306.1 SRPBCC family protein [Rhizobium laguerreae]